MFDEAFHIEAMKELWEGQTSALDQIQQLSVDRFYDYPIEGRVVLKDGREGNYCIVRDLADESEDMRYFNLSYLLYDVRVEGNLIGSLDYEGVAKFRPLTADGKYKQSHSNLNVRVDL